MAEFVDTTVKEIDSRIEELRKELARLEAARAALLGNGSVPSVRASRPSQRGARGRRPGRPRGSRGGNTRAVQALRLVEERPGITIPQMAEAMKIEPNYLYRVMPRLAREGQLRRDGPGWHPAG